MEHILKKFTRYLTNNFWFQPILLTLAGGIAGYFSVSFDETELARRWLDSWAVMVISVDGSRTLVSTVAGGIVTMASLVFSLTFVALTLMSQQLGPRLIKIFVRDQFARLAFGSFMGAYLFCLVVLAVTGTGQKSNFVPIFSSVTVIALAVASFCLMIFYINHIARSIQADTLIALLGRQLGEALDRDQAAWVGDDESDKAREHADRLEELVESDSAKFVSRSDGYIASFDTEALVKILRDNDLHAASLARPGHFVTAGSALLCLDAEVSGDVEDAIAEVFEFEHVRMSSEAGEFEINALVEVALRALSPGLNDSYTAVACIDHLTTVLARLACAPVNRKPLLDEDGEPRLLPYDQGFENLVSRAFHPIRHAARDNPMVLDRLINVFRVIAEAGQGNKASSRIAREHLKAVEHTIEDGVSVKQDRDHLLEQVRKALKDLS